MRFSGPGPMGKVAARLAALSVPPFYGRVFLARVTDKGYISPTATIWHPGLALGANCFIDDDVTIYRDMNGGIVELSNGVLIFRGTTIQTGEEGTVSIGADTHIQPRCQFSAYKGSIQIGARVEIAPGCAFYPYNHGMALNTPIREQPIYSELGITVGDDAWLGYGVILLDGAQVGKGAVVGAGSVVTGHIPDGAIAVGSPAKLIKMRG
jgi:acetyltransferase-like isoleucine patch superfamily enzyme